MSKCESNVNELIVSDLVGIPGTVSSRLADFRDWRGDASADVSELEIALRTLRFAGRVLRRSISPIRMPATPRFPLSLVAMWSTHV